MAFSRVLATKVIILVFIMHQAANLADFQYKESIEIDVNLSFSIWTASLICEGYLLVNSHAEVGFLQ